MAPVNRLLGAWPAALFASLALLIVYFELYSTLEVSAAFPVSRIQHFALFTVLAGAGAHAFPRAPLPLMGLALAAFGAGLEMMELRDVLDRTFSLMDWVAELAGIASALAMAAMLKGRLASRHYRRLKVEPANPLLIELLFIAVGVLGLLAVVMQSPG